MRTMFGVLDDKPPDVVKSRKRALNSDDIVNKCDPVHFQEKRYCKVTEVVHEFMQGSALAKRLLTKDSSCDTDIHSPLPPQTSAQALFRPPLCVKGKYVVSMVPVNAVTDFHHAPNTSSRQFASRGTYPSECAPCDNGKPSDRYSMTNGGLPTGNPNKHNSVTFGDTQSHAVVVHMAQSCADQQQQYRYTRQSFKPPRISRVQVNMTPHTITTTTAAPRDVQRKVSGIINSANRFPGVPYKSCFPARLRSSKRPVKVPYPDGLTLVVIRYSTRIICTARPQPTSRLLKFLNNAYNDDDFRKLCGLCRNEDDTSYCSSDSDTSDLNDLEPDYEQDEQDN